MRRPVHVRLAVVISAVAISGCDEKNASQPSAPASSPITIAASTPKGEPPMACAETPTPRVITEEVTYSAGGTTMKGLLAYPSNAKGLPGVLVVHEWWGRNEYAQHRAEMLAKAGYAALAVDMYGDGKVVDHPDEAKKLSSAVYAKLDQAVQRFEAAKKVLQEHGSTDPDRIAAIGYCFGGGLVLHMARTGMDLDLVASFHGVLATKTPAAKGAIKGRVLVAHGAADAMVPPEQVEAFKKEMEAAGVELHFHAYEGAKHAFSNPAATKVGEKFNMPVAYDEKADRASWNELTTLLSEVFPSDKQ